MSWPRRTLIDLLGIEHPIIQAPMAGASTAALAAAVSNAGALGGVGGPRFGPGGARQGNPAFLQAKKKTLLIKPFFSSPPALFFPAEPQGAPKKELSPPP